MARGVLDRYTLKVKRRDYKEFATGAIYHLYNRGNNKERVFYDEQDYRSFLFRIGLILGIPTDILNSHEITTLPKSRVRLSKIKIGQFNLHAFCLMPNHFHLLLEQRGETSISKFMSKLSTSFAMYINKKYKRVGYVFQDRFKSVLIESNPQLMWNVSYIHMNPVKDGVVVNPYDYKWSSYNDFAGERKLPITSQDLILPLFETRENFIKQNFVLSKDVARGVLDTFK